MASALQNFEDSRAHRNEPSSFWSLAVWHEDHAILPVQVVDTHPEEFQRADVLEFTPEGKFVKVYASGLRNCVGEAIQPETG